jgi:lysophospholipase L1-like esterase
VTGRKQNANWFEKNPKKTLVGIICMGILIGLILAELGARIFLPHWGPTRAERADFWSFDDKLGWAHEKNQQGRFNHPDFSVDVRINSHGQRDDEYSLARTDKKRMLILGDSFGWGFGVEHDEIFCEIIENNHPDWEIINASVSGYSTDQEFLYLKERGIHFEPDVVLLLFSTNDFRNNVVDEQCWYYKPRYVLSNDQLILENVPVPKSTLVQKLDRFFFGKTYLLKRIYLKIKIIGIQIRSSGKTRTKGERSETPNKPAQPKKEQYRYQLVKRLIAEINNYSAERGARFVLVSVPLAEEQRRVLEEVAAREEIPYLPLNESIGQATGEVTFKNDDHWNVKGQKIVADSIERFLIREGIID